MKDLTKKFVLIFVVFLVIAGLFSMYAPPFEEENKVELSTLIEQVNKEEVESIEIDGDKLAVKLTNGSSELVLKENTESLSNLFKNYEIPQEKIQKVNIVVKEKGGFEFWMAALLPILIPVIFIAAIIYFMMRQVQGANSRAMMFGQSKAREVTNQSVRDKITFKEVAGAKEAKEELKEVVEFLRNPKKFLSLGARIPKGVLLVGPPGTGKTLLARAVAGEASVPFFNISGSEFVEMFVGVGASRVRDLFRRAKKSSPCIVFIDELDAVGRQRGAGLGGSNDEREQTLNQILVEMDGFDANTNIIIMAATNRPDVLDVALLRPGRFDRQVVLDMPDISDREAILHVHIKNKPIVEGLDLRKVAARTPGFTGADLSNLLNEAAILTARRNKKQVGISEILESIEKVMLGPERKSHILTDHEKKITAYHEAGHALVAHELPNTDPVHKISIVSRGRAAGYTLKLPLYDKHMHTKAEFVDDLAVLLAGYTTEKEIFGDISTGAANDLKEATRLARRLIMEYGMANKLPPRTFGKREELIFLGREIHEQRDYSEKVAEGIDLEIGQFIQNAIKTAQTIVRKTKPKLDQIAKILLEKETLEKEEFESLFAKSAEIPV